MTTAANSETASSGPEIAKCAWCGSAFTRSRKGQRFCNPNGDRVAPCAKAWNALNTARGGPALPFLQAWAMTRHAKPGTREAEINRYARREITDMARAFNAEDKAEGRASVLDYVGALMDSKAIYADRRR